MLKSAHHQLRFKRLGLKQSIFSISYSTITHKIETVCSANQTSNKYRIPQHFVAELIITIDSTNSTTIIYIRPTQHWKPQTHTVELMFLMSRDTYLTHQPQEIVCVLPRKEFVSIDCFQFVQACFFSGFHCGVFHATVPALFLIMSTVIMPVIISMGFGPHVFPLDYFHLVTESRNKHMYQLNEANTTHWLILRTENMK